MLRGVVPHRLQNLHRNSLEFTRTSPSLLTAARSVSPASPGRVTPMVTPPRGRAAVLGSPGAMAHIPALTIRSGSGGDELDLDEPRAATSFTDATRAGSAVHARISVETSEFRVKISHRSCAAGAEAARCRNIRNRWSCLRVVEHNAGMLGTCPVHAFLAQCACRPYGAGFPLPRRSAIGTYASPSRGGGSRPVMV